MLGFLLYDLKAAALVAVFYMFYRLLLSRETFHTVNRVVLLSTAAASFVLPLCVVTIHHTVTVSPTTGSIAAELPTMGVLEPSAAWWQQAAVGVFLAGVVATLAHQLWSLAQVMLLIRRSEHHRQPDGITICVTQKKVSPFSWMHYIVLSPGDYAALDAAVLAHERGHIRRRHTLDLLLVDTLTALQWFNPAMWMLRQDLRAIHEYEADAAVLSQGINMRQYQYLLIQKAVGDCGYSVVNGISHSTLKNRITMMLHKKSSSASLLKLLALVPVVGITLALNAETVNDYVYQQPQKKIVKKGRKDAQLKSKLGVISIANPAGDQEPYDKVEQMPEFPGGLTAMIKFVMENVRYPKAAMETNKQGTVVVEFIVEKDGKVSHAKAIQSVSDEIDAEAIRVVNAMPKWTPGKQDGKNVRVRFSMPVTFNLN